MLLRNIELYISTTHAHRERGESSMQNSIQKTLAERWSLNEKSPSRPIQYMETVDAYDKWAEVWYFQAH